MLLSTVKVRPHRWQHVAHLIAKPARSTSGYFPFAMCAAVVIGQFRLSFASRSPRNCASLSAAGSVSDRSPLMKR